MSFLWIKELTDSMDDIVGSSNRVIWVDVHLGGGIPDKLDSIICTLKSLGFIELVTPPPCFRHPELHCPSHETQRDLHHFSKWLILTTEHETRWKWKCKIKCWKSSTNTLEYYKIKKWKYVWRIFAWKTKGRNCLLDLKYPYKFPLSQKTVSFSLFFSWNHVQIRFAEDPLVVSLRPCSIRELDLVKMWQKLKQYGNCAY